MSLVPARIFDHEGSCVCPCCATDTLANEAAAMSTGTGNGTSKPISNNAEVVSDLTTNWFGGRSYAWDSDTVSYSTSYLPAADGFSEAAGWRAMTEFMRSAADEAIELWDDLIAINITETPNNANSDIALNYSSTTGDSTYAKISGAPGGNRADQELQNSDIWFASGWRSLDQENDFYQGNGGLLVYIHEIGHALGLSHPGQYNGTASFETNAEYFQDTRQYTVMSYFTAGQNGENVDHVGADGLFSQAATPLLHDILAIQSIYGADMTTRTGATTYGFNSTAGRSAFDFTENTDPVVAIWDAGGVDTIDVSGWNTNQLIDLTAGAFSSVGALTKNLAIAEGAVIENAIGGGGDDTLDGNAASNRLEGGAGADTLSGGAGADILVGGRGIDTLSGGSGADIFLFEGSDQGGVIADLTAADTLRFASAAAASDVLSSATQFGDDAVLNLNGTSLRIQGVESGALFRTGNELKLGSANQSTLSFGDDTYSYRKADGIVLISAAEENASSGADDRLVFNDLSLSDLTFDRSDGNLRALWNDGSNSGSLTAANDGAYIERFEFSDGSALSAVDADFLANRSSNAIAGDTRDALHGSSDADQITGTAESDFIFGYDGDDVLDAGAAGSAWQYLYGQGGNDTYRYGKEGERVFIHTETETSGVDDRIVLTDLALSDVLFAAKDSSNSAHGSQLQIVWDDGTNSGEVRVTQAATHIESFEFSDGSTLAGIGADFLANRATNAIAGDTRDALYGTDRSDIIIGTEDSDFIYGNDGADFLDAAGSGRGWQYLYGQNGSDTYRYGKESGKVFIHSETEASGTNDRILFKDLAFSDVSFASFDSGNEAHGQALRILWDDGTNNGEVRVTHMGSHIERFEFADGVVREYDDFILS